MEATWVQNADQNDALQRYPQVISHSYGKWMIRVHLCPFIDDLSKLRIKLVIVHSYVTSYQRVHEIQELAIHPPINHSRSAGAHLGIATSIA
jgi:hypothetical protein